jgi:hypothetical protein
MEEFEFIGPNDKPALLAISSPETLQAVRSTLSGMGYKLHIVDSHFQFDSRCNQVNYPVVIIEENFTGSPLPENLSLQTAQRLPMAQRRDSVFFLIGPSFESLNTLQAFAQSVHCVLNITDLPMLKEVMQKTIGENDMFLATFREVQRRVYQKGS